MISGVWVKNFRILNVLDLFKQIGFCPYEYMSDFEKFKEDLPSKESFIVR